MRLIHKASPLSIVRRKFSGHCAWTKLRRSKCSPQSFELGMTLMEVLVASAILVFGMMGIIAVFNTAARIHKRAVDETTAVQVGASVMAELRGSFARGVLPSATPREAPTEHPDYPGYKYVVRIIDLNPKAKPATRLALGKEYMVEIKIQWSDRGDEQSTVFHTIMLLSSEISDSLHLPFYHGSFLYA